MSGPEAELWRSACRLAGLLAERGVGLVQLEAGGRKQELKSRGCDLPRKLAQAALGARLKWPGGAAACTANGWLETTVNDHPGA